MLQSRAAYGLTQSHVAAGACSCLQRGQSTRLSFPRGQQAVAIIHVPLYSARNSDRHQHLCNAAFVSLNLLNDSRRIVIAFYVLSTASGISADHRRLNTLILSACL